MHSDKEVVGTLPGDEGMMSKVQHTLSKMHDAFQHAERDLVRFSATLQPTTSRAGAPIYPGVNQRPILPVQPVLPVLPVQPK